MATLVERVADVLSKEIDSIPAKPEEAVRGTEIAKKLAPHLVGVQLPSIQAAISSVSGEQLAIKGGDGKTYLLIRRAGKVGYFRQEIIEKNGAREFSPSRSPLKVQSENKSPLSQDGDDDSSSFQLEEKFRALLFYFDEFYSDSSTNIYPFVLKHEKAFRAKKGEHHWRFPDYLRIVWDDQLVDEESLEFRKELLEIKRALGENIFEIESWELKLKAEKSNYREAFFQSLSNSSWSHVPVLAFALKIDDDDIVEELRTLGTFYKVRVVSYNLNQTDLEQCSSPEKIYQMRGETQLPQVVKGPLEKIRENLQIISPGEKRASIDWGQLSRLKHSHMNLLQQGIQICLSKCKPESFQKLAKKIELDAAESNEALKEICASYYNLFEDAA